MRTALIAFLLVAGAAGMASAAPGLHVSVEERTLVVIVDDKPVTRLMMPAEPRQLLVRGTDAFVALGPAGLWAIDLSHPDAPSVVARIEEGHDVAGVLAGQGATILVIESPYAVVTYDVTNPAQPALVVPVPPVPPPETATPAPAAAPVPPMAAIPAAPPSAVTPPVAPPVTPPPGNPPPRPVTAALPPPPEEAPPVQGSVVKVVAGMALLDRGSAEGLIVGMHVEVFSSKMITRLSPKTGMEELLPSRESVGVLAVTAVDLHGATVEVTRGNVVRRGDQWVVTYAPVTEHFVFPAKQDFHHRLEAILRPFVEVGSVGVGFINQVRYYYRFDFPLMIDVGVTPLAFELSNSSPTRPPQAPTAFDFVLSYDTDYFSIGLGLGGVAYSAEGPSSTGPLTTGTPAGVRLGFYQFVRMGSIDGLNLEVRNSFVYREGTIGEGGNMNFQWGSTEVRGSIPLNKRLSMILESGGGDNGWVYGEVGIKTYFSGNGGRGTVIVPIGIGVGGFQEVPAAIGPLLSFGVEYRD